MRTRRLLAATFLLLAAPSLAAAEPVAIAQRRQVGELLAMDYRMKMDGRLDVSFGGESQSAALYNEDAFVAQVETTAVADGVASGERYTMASILRRTRSPETGELQDTFNGGAGAVFTVQRDPDGEVLEAKGEAGSLPDEVLQATADTSMPTPKDFGITGPVEPGSSWPMTLPGFLGEKGTVTGQATFSGLAQVGEERHATLALQVTIAATDPEMGGTMTAELGGTAVFDVASGQCRRLHITGPMSIDAATEGLSMKGGGTITMDASWTPAGTAGKGKGKGKGKTGKAKAMPGR